MGQDCGTFLQFPHSPTHVVPGYETAYPNIPQSNRRAYAGMVSFMDRSIGEIVKQFQRRGLWDNTVLVFLSDNGGVTQNGASNYPLRGGKMDFWEGGVRTPAFVTSPLLKSTAGRERKLFLGFGILRQIVWDFHVSWDLGGLENGRKCNI